MYIWFITFPQPYQYQNQLFIVWIYCVQNNSFWENDRLDYKCILLIKTECSGAPRQQSDGNEPPWLRFEQRGDGRLGVQIPRVVQETGAAALPGHPRHDDAPPVLRAGGRHLLYCSNIQGLILWTTSVLDENNHIKCRMPQALLSQQTVPCWSVWPTSVLLYLAWFSSSSSSPLPSPTSSLLPCSSKLPLLLL